jgi:hypothetical protein
MIYKCRNCDFEEGRGCLPSVTCGLYMIFLMGCATFILSFSLAAIRGGEPNPIDGLGWWKLLAIPVAAIISLVAAVIGGLLLNYVFEFVEWLVYCRRKCPKCGSRRWSWGFTRGFGL